jgi:hypothetical protein
MPRRHHLPDWPHRRDHPGHGAFAIERSSEYVHGRSSRQFLRSKIREGNVEFEADTSKDTPGSDPIKNVLLDDSYRKPEWPGIEFRQMSTATWGYGARSVVRPEFARYLSAEWMLR